MGHLVQLAMSLSLFGILFISLVRCYNIGVISGDFPIFEISDGDTFMKRETSDGGNMPSDMKDSVHGVKMGVSSDICDNAKDNLETDWKGSPLNYTCYHPKNRLPVVKAMKPIEDCTNTDKFFARHFCMNEKIEYKEMIPTFGNHRPLWPIYGEYVYIPPQRWLHNLEHGAVVMLYHPCAEPGEVKKLKKIVKGCLRRHVITPYQNLSADKPLALVTWGCKLQMNYVDENVVKSFIKNHALRGPEQTAREGQYKFKLTEIAIAPTGSNYKDKKLCPN
ncbi:hypothetical protein JTE90_017054 [Oedothorax gibbosus]|uniref:DUF3105 domain-containing protein n=1 Tax=Oedothorax gibbosus TaxID=931172 RepID=A0AAV6ULB2_9ARAC|nr:hypothetical protein JTE90_017054 [Oedothorax gibbosus]